MMCLKGFDNCKCDRCKIDNSIKRAEQKLKKLNEEFNKASKNYHAYLDIIQTDFKFKQASNFDQKSKELWLTLQEKEKLCQKQIYRLNSLERKRDLFSEVSNNESF